MPSSVGQQLSRKLDRMGVELRQAQAKAVTAAAMELKKAVQVELNRDAPGGRMRGVGKKGAKVGVRFDRKGDDTAVLRMTGPAHLLERGHKGGYEVRPKKKKAVMTPFGPRAVTRPGPAKGKHTMSHGIEKGRPKAVAELRNVTTNAVRRGMRG